jgi:hypothetical protein
MNTKEKEQLFLNYLYSLGDEFQLVGKYHEKHRTMMGMVFIDIAAQIWDGCINEKNSNNKSNNKSRFNRWCTDFICVSSPNFESEDLYKLRCSLLHFGGIPKPYMFEEHYRSVYETSEFLKISTNLQVKVIPEMLIADIAKGFINMIKRILSMYSTTEKKCQTYEKFINRMVKKIETDGSFMVMEAVNGS